MYLIKGATGLDCEECHVQKDFSADSKDLKLTARKMIQMVLDLNKASFDGKQTVTCYTCHRGNPVPTGTPVLPVVLPQEAEKINLPSVDCR